MKIAWIGTGVMGSAMAKHLAKAGHSVTAYNRTQEKCEALQKFGILTATTIANCVKDAEVVFSIVGTPKDVEEIYLQEDGIFANAPENCLCIDMTTSSPFLAKKLYTMATSGKMGKIFRILDAPVSGGNTGAQNATLAIMVGGDVADFKIALPLFELMGKNIKHLGIAGNGQHCKACNQITVAGNIAACAEAISYARENGLDANIMHKAICTGAAGSWQMDNNAPRMLQEDYTAYFMNEHYLKDLKIAQDAMKEVGKSLPVLDIITDMYQKLVDDGFGKEGTQGIIKLY